MKPFAMACLSVSMVLVAGDVASAQRVKNVEIEAEKLVGELPRPILDRGTGRGTVAHDELIRPPADFVREIVTSAQEP